MVTVENLTAYANPKVHPEINRLNSEQRQRIKNFIDELIQQTNKEFQISELTVMSDRIEIAVEYKWTMI